MTGDAHLPIGPYEDLVTSALEERIAELAGTLAPVTRDLADYEAADRFALHVSSAIRRALSAQDEKGRAHTSARIVRSLLRHLGQSADHYEADPDLPAPAPRVLAGIVRRNPDGSTPRLESPITPLLDTTVLTNSRQDQNMWAHLNSEIRSAAGVDAIVAFIRVPGINPLLSSLEAQVAAGHELRVLTTTFTGFTQVEALERLRDIGAQIKVSYDTSSTRLHAKAWIFHRPANTSTAFVGSSNATAHALQGGMEWNVRLAERRNPDAVAKVKLTFDSYWESDEFRPFDAHEFRAEIALPPAGDEGGFVPVEITPHPFQERLLEKLAVARTHGHHRNLLVAATGTGKTVMSALDYRRLRRTLPSSRLLFVAHREEILDQSLRTFRLALGDPTFGEKWVGGSRPERYTHVFASIQSLAAAGLANLDPRHFDVVIVDEFHHAAAQTYVRLLDHVQPRELLGLTATPERADGQSVLHHFDGRIGAELRLWDAIAEGRLVPFQYFGIHDGVSLETIPWRRGRGYDVNALANVYTSNDAWARLVIKKTADHVASPRAMRALGFCVNVEHARFMASRFNAARIPSVAVWGDSPETERRRALEDLRAGRVNAVFSVDLFNEGVDIPSIDTLLMLRPTESATLFLQQLGRGLRRTPEKDVCTVLDFVGHHRREFRFDLKFRAILGGGTRKDIERNIQLGFPNLPPGVSVNLDHVAQQTILDSIRNALPTRWPQRVAELRDLVAAGHQPTLATYLQHTGLELEDLYDGSHCWSDLLEAAVVPTAAPGPHETIVRRAIGRLLHIDDELRITTYQRILAGGRPNVASLTERERRLWRMLITQLAAPITAANRGMSSQAASDQVWRHGQVRAELAELLSLLGDRLDHVHRDVPDRSDLPLQVHARYTRMEILAALNSGDPDLARVPDWREGVKWLPEAGVDAFLITLDKSGSNFSPTTAYRDFAISRTLFHWESQSTTSESSPTGQRYQHHVAQGSAVYLFARINDDDRAFWFLGPASYVSHEGSRPMAVTWRLGVPLPADLHIEFAAVEVA